jgi:hypothetical protein
MPNAGVARRVAIRVAVPLLLMTVALLPLATVAHAQADDKAY